MAAVAAESAVQRFESLLEDLVSEHRRWLDAVRAHRAAIASASADGLERAIADEVACGERVAALDARRAEVLAALGATGRLSEVAAGLPEPARSRACRQAAELRELALVLRREAEVVRTASVSLMAHVRGIFTQVAAALNHAGTYGRAGRVDAGPVVVSSLDVRR